VYSALKVFNDNALYKFTFDIDIDGDISFRGYSARNRFPRGRFLTEIGVNSEYWP